MWEKGELDVRKIPLHQRHTSDLSEKYAYSNHYTTKKNVMDPELYNKLERETEEINTFDKEMRAISLHLKNN